MLRLEEVYTQSMGEDQEIMEENSSRLSKDDSSISSDPCYDQLTGQAQRCIPNFENVAYNRRVIASSTCGSPPMSYCIQNGVNGASMMSKSSAKHVYCDKCDARIGESMRETKYLTDLEETNTTCWVSGPVYEPAHMSNLTLDISFGKKYELTYIRLFEFF